MHNWSKKLSQKKKKKKKKSFKTETLRAKQMLKGNTTVIFNKNMLESMSIQIFPTYCFCCTILLIIKINLLCSPLLVSISSVRRLTRHGNWIKVYVKLATRHAQCKISVENFDFCAHNEANLLENSCPSSCLLKCQNIIFLE